MTVQERGGQLLQGVSHALLSRQRRPLLRALLPAIEEVGTTAYSSMLDYSRSLFNPTAPAVKHYRVYAE